MIYVFFASISDGARLHNHIGPIYYPLGFSLKGYEIILRHKGILQGYLNTIIYVVFGTSLSLFLTLIAAYVLAQPSFKLKKFFTFLLVFTMYFDGGLIPRFLLVRDLGLLDTRLAIILVGCIGTWNVIIYKTVIQHLPQSLFDAAHIDGASHYQILFTIVAPLTKPTMAVIFLFYAVGQWNGWFNAMIYLQDRSKYPLQLRMREILLSGSKLEG